MQSFRRFIGIRLLVPISCAISLFSYSNASESPLMKAIEQVVSADAEVIAWERALADTSAGVSIYEVMKAPELRLEAEQDEVDETLRIGTALRWNLDEGDSKSLRKKQREFEEQLVRSKLRVIRDSLRFSLKRDCLQISNLKSEVENLSECLHLKRERLARDEEVSEHKKIRSLSLLKNRSELIVLESDVNGIQNDIDRLASGLMMRGLPKSLIDSVSLESTWMICLEPGSSPSKSDGDIAQLVEAHPEAKMSFLRNELDLETLKEVRRKTGLSLSYVQLQYEEEDDRDQGENESSFGVSFGVNLPFWKKASRMQGLSEHSIAEADLVSDLQETRRDIGLAYGYFQNVREREQERIPELNLLIDELELLRETMESNDFLETRNEDLDIGLEACRLEMALKELRFDTLSAGLELERTSLSQVLTMQ